jgi:hypothetical protein
MNSMRFGTIAAAAAAILVAGACSDERAITSAPVGALGFGQNMARQATNLPRGRVLWPNTPIASATPANDSIIVELAGLDSLTAGAYTVWVGNDSGTKFARLSGNLTISRLDTTLNAQGDPVFTRGTATVPNVGQFRNGRQNYLMRFASTRALATGLANTDSANVLLVSVEAGAPGATPGERRNLWARRGTTTATADTFTVSGQLRRVGGLRFGNFAPRTSEEFVYATSTSTRTAFPAEAFVTAAMPIIPRGRIEVRGPVFTVNDSNYYRPPIGYYYEAWAIRTDTMGRFTDTISLGQKATPFPSRKSFYEADKIIVDAKYMFGSPSPVIFASQHRVSADSIPAATPAGKKPWNEFMGVFVTLQNKAAPPERMGAVVIMSGGTPGSVSGR